MKTFLPTIFAIALIAAGCSLFRDSETPSNPWADMAVPPPSTNSLPASALANPTPATVYPAPAKGQKLIVTPGNGYAGKVDIYNEDGHFVVLDFPIGNVPPVDQQLSVYRQGLKIGQIKITGPQRENRTVADLVDGEARKGDEVKDK